MKQIEITTRDGLNIVTCVFEPPVSVSAKAGVIINSATGVKQSFYSRFASFLAKQGYQVITFDYRGIGLSCNTALNDPRLTMKAWGEQDLEGVIDWATQNYSELSWHCVGHSVGGQLIGLASNHHKLASCYGIAAQNGNWRNWGFKQQLSFAPTCYLVIPMLSKLLGYFPGAVMGGEHLPKGVAIEWARWCRSRHYICDENGKPYRPYFSDVQMPMHFLVLDDDHQFAPEKAVRALASFYDCAKVTIEITSAQERLHKPLGHFGFFRTHHKALWNKTIDWLESQKDAERLIGDQIEVI